MLASGRSITWALHPETCGCGCMETVDFML
jgi:hypothetical protein